MKNETIKERFLGTIFGQAVGDALGLSTEFMSKQEVDQFYPNGIEDYSQIVQDAQLLKNGGMVFSMLLCSITRCRNSTQCIDKNLI